MFCVHVGRVYLTGKTKVTKTVQNGSNGRTTITRITGSLPGGWNPFKPVNPNNRWKPVNPNNRWNPNKPSGNSSPGSSRGSGGSPSSSTSVSPSGIVNKHNDLRRNVSPPASDMLKMVNAEFHNFQNKLCLTKFYEHGLLHLA